MRYKVTDVHRIAGSGVLRVRATRRVHGTVFREAGIPARAVSGDTRDHDQSRSAGGSASPAGERYCSQLICSTRVWISRGRHWSCSCDPQSATLFLQQLGRGLRRCQAKAVLTALDFTRPAAPEFRFDVRCRALIRIGRKTPERQIEQVPLLPSGSATRAGPRGADIVLENVRHRLRLTRRALPRSCSPAGICRWQPSLSESGRDLADVYRGASCGPLCGAPRTIDPERRPAEDACCAGSSL